MMSSTPRCGCTIRTCICSWLRPSARLERCGWQTPLGGRLALKRYPVARKDIYYGAMVFGVGWALSGACPGPALAAAAGARPLALLVVAGLFGGLLLRDAVVARQSGRREASTDLGALTPQPLTAGLAHGAFGEWLRWAPRHGTSGVTGA